VADLEQIVSECKRYNKFAQKLLYEMYAPQMRGLCFRYLGDAETAKDIVQEGFLKVFSNIKQFKGKGSFEGWMKRIFINTAITYIRKNNKKNRHLNFEDINESEISDVVDEPIDQEQYSEKDNVGLVMNAELSGEELMEALQRVPEKFRTVFNLFIIEQLKHDEIAEILEIDKTTSRTRLSRARNLIQKELYAISHKKLTYKTDG